MAKKSKSLSVPPALQETYNAIVKLTDEYCKQYLNTEYKQLCHQMAAALARKRPSPLMSGRVNTWACGIVYALGRVNFLFDKSQKPHVRADDLCAGFGVAASTGAGKSKDIQRIFNIGLMDPAWTLPGRMERNPMAWMVSVNGYIVDARGLPRELQEEAYRKGLIPHLP
jgi:hypothetical protein